MDYLHIMLAGLVPFFLVQVYAGSLREMNESLIPMTAGLFSVIVDIIFNYMLIYGKLGFPALGVRGAAIATVIAQFISTVLVIWYMVKRFSSLELHARHFKPDLKLYGQMAAIGVGPAFNFGTQAIL